jgi:GT2 family glycosyltransferase
MTFKGALISMAMVPEIGLPIGDYFLMMEEYEYCLRAIDAGFRHYALPEPLLVPLEAEPPGRYPPWRGYYQVRNHLAMVIKRRSPGELLGFLIVQGKYLVGAVRVGERIGERLRLRLLGAWHALRGVTGKTIDPARWAAKPPPAPPAGTGPRP